MIMKPILFCGKSIDNSRYYCGGYVHETEENGKKVDRHYIIPVSRRHSVYNCKSDAVLVEKDSVTQFSGYYDRKHRRIFDNALLSSNGRTFMFTPVVTDYSDIMQDNNEIDALIVGTSEISNIGDVQFTSKRDDTKSGFADLSTYELGDLIDSLYQNTSFWKVALTSEGKPAVNFVKDAREVYVNEAPQWIKNQIKTIGFYELALREEKTKE